MLKFGIMSYFVLNLTQNLTFVKFDTENSIALENKGEIGKYSKFIYQ